ncbi:MAG TPA: hypothetical protein DCS82_12410 [Rhodospirillaceae bacterium]|nr:hypothetical protein [Rhodospirillaceae bacterium]HAA93831.1 hypothetical protein [Rhodospirillaceae bacterium]HAT36509.1 hypothetical protein [Rhodospirillaceae bacterium]|tara:strand:+ start:360 stop:950 length:591 start_codon:yes stop_codon:yes gene_type:complete
MFSTRFLRHFLLCICVSLAACETLPETASPEPITFTSLPPISLDVARIEIQRVYRPPLKLPNVEHEMPVTLLDTADRWAKERLRAVGRYGTARVTIDRASVIETKLKKTGGIRGAFTTDQAERYDATLVIAIEAWGGTGKGSAVARTTVKSTRTVAEDASLADRERVWHDMVATVLAEMNTAFEARIRRHLGAYVK